MHSKLMSHRFDSPGGWRWKCRFSLEELKVIYRKLFGYNKFELHKNHSFTAIEDYDMCKDDVYGAMKLEDGGVTSLEFKSKESLDWFLLVGAWFGKYTAFNEDREWIANPLHGKLSREEALVVLDLLPEKFGSDLLANESMSHINSRQLV